MLIPGPGTKEYIILSRANTKRFHPALLHRTHRKSALHLVQHQCTMSFAVHSRGESSVELLDSYLRGPLLEEDRRKHVALHWLSKLLCAVL